MSNSVRRSRRVHAGTAKVMACLNSYSPDDDLAIPKTISKKQKNYPKLADNDVNNLCHFMTLSEERPNDGKNENVTSLKITDIANNVPLQRPGSIFLSKALHDITLTKENPIISSLQYELHESEQQNLKLEAKLFEANLMCQNSIKSNKSTQNAMSSLNQEVSRLNEIIYQLKNDSIGRERNNSEVQRRLNDTIEQLKVDIQIVKNERDVLQYNENETLDALFMKMPLPIKVNPTSEAIPNQEKNEDVSMEETSKLMSIAEEIKLIRKIIKNPIELLTSLDNIIKIVETSSQNWNLSHG